MFWTNIYAQIKLFPLRKKKVQIWTKYNAMYHLIEGGFYAFPCPTIEDKHYLARHMCKHMDKHKVAVLSGQLGYPFEVYPFGDELLYRIDDTDTK